jgi:hypothetical protein
MFTTITILSKIRIHLHCNGSESHCEGKAVKVCHVMLAVSICICEFSLMFCCCGMNIAGKWEKAVL